MGFKISKVLGKAARIGAAYYTFGASEALGAGKSIQKTGQSLTEAIKEDPGKAALIAGASALTGGVTGLLAAGAGAYMMNQGYKSQQKAEKQQEEYNKAVAQENERASAAKRASLLSLKRQYTKKVGTAGVGGGGSNNNETDTLLG